MPAPNKQPIKKTVTVQKEASRTKPLQPKGPFHFRGRKFNIIFILSVIGLCFALYGNTIPNEFSLDDEFVMHNDTIVAKGISGIPELFKTRYAWDQKGGYGYRPIVKATFSIEYSLFKDSPHWGHFINILIYAFICIFLFYFFRKLLYSQLSDYFLLIMLALFLTHPLHSEVVASLKNRDEMLVFIFGFYCCFAMLQWFEAEKVLPRFLWGFSGCLSLGLGVLSKPDAEIFIPVTALILYFFTSNGIRAAISSFLCMTVFLLLGYVMVIKHVLPHTDYHRTFVYIENPLVGVHWYQKIPLAFSIVWFYISKMVFPKDLVCYYGYDAFDSFPPWIDFGVIAGILLSGFLVYLAVKNFKEKNAFLFIVLLFLGTLFPYTDIFRVGAGIVAERFMFIPSITFCMLITYLLFYLLKIPVDKKPFGKPANYAYAFTIGVCVIFSIRVIARNPDWKTHQSVYLHDSKEAPRSAKLQALLAATYVEAAQKIKASNPQRTQSIDSLFLAGEKGYQNSVDIYSGYGTSWNNLGMIQYTLYANIPKAISDFRKALNIDSEYSEAWFNLGACYEVIANKSNDTLNLMRHDSTLMAKGKYSGNEIMGSLVENMTIDKNRIQHYRDEAEQCYFHTIKLKPSYYLSYIYLSRLYFSEAQYNKVIEFDENALRKGYQSDVVYVTMGNAYLMLNDTANAVIDYEKSVRYYTKNYYVCGFLKRYYYKKGDMDKARYYGTLYDSAMMFKQSHTPIH
jgi:protein O-mannosyl-transferase